MESPNYNKIIDKTYTYLPQNSIIGRFLDHLESCIIVKSNEKGIFEHDIFSWQIVGTKLLVLNQLSKKSEFFYNLINTWLQKTTITERKIFIDEIFNLLSSTNSTTITELRKSKTKQIKTILKSYNNMNSDKRKIIKKMIIELIKSSFKKNVFLQRNYRFLNKNSVKYS